MSAFLFWIYTCPAQEEPKAQAGATPTLEAVCKLLDELDTRDMNAKLDSWVNPELVKKLSKVELTDEYIRVLYKEFEKTVVEPPDPEKYKVYGIDNGEESLVKVTELGKRIHNLIYSHSEEVLQQYGPILAAMRDVLLLDGRCIPLAIKHDNSRDIYWYGLHTEWMKNAKMEYSQLNDVTETKVIHYNPPMPLAKDMKVRLRSCWRTSIKAPRKNAWRCMVGNEIFDPCFSIEDGEYVIYPAYLAIDNQDLLIKLTKPLPEPEVSSNKTNFGWLIELADGTVSGFMTGATALVDGKRVTYDLSDHDSEYVVILGKLRPGKVWTAEKATLGQKDAGPNDDGWFIIKSEIVPIRTVWQ